MNSGLLSFTLLVATFHLFRVPEVSACKVTAQTQSGRVCGSIIQEKLASFLGVPYAEQPVGERRFMELQPLKPWEGVFNATVEGPICPQVDRLFGTAVKPQGMSEACIHANVYTPVAALPTEGGNCSRLPVLVFVHGGVWQAGSGDPDVYGPEYFVNRSVVVITFNYRLSIFGFMSLNTSSVPGNQGLRDIVHLLRWVKQNVHFFGGNPDDVTFFGQSVGAASAHLVALSPAAKGLFKRVILSSGTALPAFFSTSPFYAQYVSGLMLGELGINGSDPDAAFRKLIDLPLDNILSALDVVQNKSGLLTFSPVQETRYEGITTVVTEDPSDLIQKGALKDVPFLIGFNTGEFNTFQHRVQDLKFVDAVKANPTLLLTAKLISTSSNETARELAAEIQKYFFKDGEITYEGFINASSNAFFVYPVLKLAQIRAATGSSNTYLYQFGYEGQFRPVVVGQHLDPFKGVGHGEDLTYIFRMNAVLNEYPPQNTPVDDRMRTAWIDTIINFMKCSRPVCGKHAHKWPAVSKKALAYQNIKGPGKFHSSPLSDTQRHMVNFFDKIGSVV